MKLISFKLPLIALENMTYGVQLEVRGPPDHRQHKPRRRFQENDLG